MPGKRRRESRVAQDANVSSERKADGRNEGAGAPRGRKGLRISGHVNEVPLEWATRPRELEAAARDAGPWRRPLLASFASRRGRAGRRHTPGKDYSKCAK